ncbi:MAG: carboxypeptidase regulatory-like domain-containing protein, partial [Bryobacteraceae bacterium]|nr:carboxypeptidase regulatory-like domain-containing protein [Bryobacteraceae bacterium]
MLRTKLFALLASVSLLALPVAAQQISGSITGTVRDSQQAAIVGAKVTLTNKAQGTAREITTNAEGIFFFNPLQPAEYDLVIESSGFKKYEQKDIKVFANDRIALPDIVLEVGALTETVTVEASVAQLQTQSAERAGVVTGRQVVDIQTSQRNFLDIVRTVPGIVYTGGLGGIQANGNRGNQNNFTLDGVNAVDTGSNGGTHTNVNLDAIGEFKIITNSQPAEFGRSSGAAINVVTKSGTRDLHATGYWFYRHDSLNANTWRNNFEGRARQRRRQNWAGYNVGGPVLLPFTDFNRNRDKLFFFFAQEWQRQLVPNALRSVNVPTALERQGDFSQSREGDGSPVQIKDPTTGQPFPGNRIPQDRLSADGRKILNFYPLPNRPGVDPNFNYQSEISHGLPVQQTIVRG